MRYGFVLPGGTAPEQLEMAVLAEESGWDGVFVWEGTYAVDPWALLAAMSQKTSRVKLGTVLTPLPWRRPWKLAAQVATLDQLSGGRAILAVGLGAPDVLGATSEERDRKLRAERLDEGLEILRRLWTGEQTFSGKHYTVEARPDMAGSVKPVQQPHPPVWVVGLWPKEKSMRRILRADGLLPNYAGPDGGHGEPEPARLREMVAWLRERGGAGEGFDVITEGETPANDRDAARAIVQPWEQAGGTWWLEERWQSQDPLGEVRERLAAGPPR